MKNAYKMTIAVATRLPVAAFICLLFKLSDAAEKFARFLDNEVLPRCPSYEFKLSAARIAAREAQRAAVVDRLHQ